MRSAASVLLCCLVLALTGCFQTRQIPAVVPDVGTTGSTLVGPEGGEIRLDDLLVTIPAGAVAAGTQIEVFIDAPEPSSVFTAFSPVVRLEPAGMELATPIELRIPFHGDGRAPGVFAERVDGGALVPIPTEIHGDVAITNVSYLASTFVGTACEGSECACTPNGQLDLLVVVDNSNSMMEEQALLQAQLPGLFRALASGDTNGDGVQDVAAFDSIRVGVTTTDLGTGEVTGVASCSSGEGDAGLILGPGSSSGCASGSPRIADYTSAMPEGLDAFVELSTCNASRGIDGCGFEQQLEAALRALSPSAPTAYTAAGWTPPVFVGGAAGQGDSGNAGFLRDDSILVVLWVTDEEDCSTTNDALFDEDDPAYSPVGLNLRCFSFPEQLQPVQRFVDGIVGLRRRPEDVIVAAVTGTPTGFDTTPGAIDYQALLDTAAMQEQIDPADPTRLLPSCTASTGVAYPPRRIVSVLRGIDESGARVVLGSICDPTFADLASDLGTQLAERASGGC